MTRETDVPIPHEENSTIPVACVVPAFEPVADDIERLVKVLLRETAHVLVVDDGSTSNDYLARLDHMGATTKAHATNAGIARSLNDGLRFAEVVGARWLLTIDQDSMVGAGYVAALLRHADERAGVIGAEIVGDAEGDLEYPHRLVSGVMVTEEIFQTGSLWSVPVMRIIGGFDEALGLDAVDAAACLALRESGYGVVLAQGTRVEHHYGESRRVRLLGRTFVASGHSPSRRESMVRNRLRLFPREFRQSPLHAFRTIRRVVVNVILGATIEEDRWSKAKGAARGVLPRNTPPDSEHTPSAPHWEPG